MNTTNNVKAGKTANVNGLTEKQLNAQLEKSYKQVVKSAKVDLKAESTSISFWWKFIVDSAQSNKDLKSALLHRLQLKKLPVKDELKRLLLSETVKGFKFYDSETKAIILNCRKKFLKDSNGETVKEDGKPVVSETWYTKKETFTFNAVYTALFTPSKVVVYIDSEDIREVEI